MAEDVAAAQTGGMAVPPQGLGWGKCPSQCAAALQLDDQLEVEKAEQPLVKAIPDGERCPMGLLRMLALSFAVGSVAREGLDPSFKMLPFPEKRNPFPGVALVHTTGTDLSAWPNGGFDFTVVFGT